jgi:glycerol-3-phosphate dehydrogenase (NAD(P)+)
VASIGIIGAGAFGTALAALFGAAGRTVSLWALEPQVVESVNRDHENPTYLRGVTLAHGIRATSELKDVAADADLLILASPAQHVRGVCIKLSSHLQPGVPLIICSKGLELRTGLLMTEVAAEVIPHARLAALSGPTFAHEVAKGLRTGAALAGPDRAFAVEISAAISTATFRAFPSDDLAGVQIGGALKNVVAIACGMSQGLGLGENGRAILMTRGLGEIARLARAKGGRASTVQGVSGVGDVALTCASEHSRNTRFGTAIGSGRALDEVLAEHWPTVTEGMHTASAVQALCGRYRLHLPLCEAMNAVLHHGADPRDALEALIS